MFVYVLQFSHIVKVGQTADIRRAKGKLGYSEEKALLGRPIVLLLESSGSRLEDESALLRLARAHFGEPITGREWFGGNDSDISRFVIDAKRYLVLRAWSSW